ncbi:MAG: hypothetical protein IKM46_01920 [Clostridia bacterium]|nr:hypothetical protein [Clostridia bacterium]
MLKTVGCILILGASSCLSLILGRLGSRRLCALAEIKRLLVFISRNIESFLTPVGVILSSYHSDYLELCGFSDAMKNDGLCAAFLRGYADLPPEAEELMINFSSELGDSYAEDEVKRCRHYITVLEEIEAVEKARVEKNRDLYRFLPPLGALSLIIILL